MAIDDAKVQALKEKYGPRLSKLEFEDAVIVLRKPSRDEYQRFRADVSDEKKRAAAAGKLVKCLVVHPPEWSEVEAIFDEYPALEDQAANAALQMAGATKEASVGKL